MKVMIRKVVVPAMFATMTSAYAATWSYTENGAIQLPEVMENSTVTVSSGVTVTNTTALTGSGRLTVNGSGTLVLAVDSPSFTGGFYVGKSTVAILSGQALGTGAVTIQGKGSTSGSSRLCFINSSAITVTNDFLCENSGANSAVNAQFTLDGSADVALSGSISGAPGKEVHFFCPGNRSIDFNGAISGAKVYCNGSGSFNFNAAVTADLVFANALAGSGSWNSKVYLANSGNRIGRLQSRKSATIEAYSGDVLGGAELYGFESKGITLHGPAQTAANIQTTSASSYVEGANEVTLTLTGGVATASSASVMKGGLCLKVEDSGSAGDFVQVQTNGTHTMTGDLIVNRGTYAIRGAATYRGVPSVRVNGGTLDIATTASSAFSGVGLLAIGECGKLKIDADTPAPFPNDRSVDVVIWTGAQYEGEPMEIKAQSLIIDGFLQPDGYYTHENTPAIPEGLVVSMVSREITLSESGAIDFVGTYGYVDGYWQITIPAGVAVTNTTALSSSSSKTAIEFLGGGTFVQTAGNSGLTATIRIGKATVVATEEYALGIGDVVISGYNKGASQLRFDTGDATMSFPNNVRVLKGCDSPTTDSAVKAPLSFCGSSSGQIALSGSIVCEAEGNYVFYGQNFTRVYFQGPVSGYSQYLYGDGHFDFSGPLTNDLLYAWSVSGLSAAKLSLSTSASSLGRLLSRKNATLNLYAENAIGGGSVTFEGKGMELHGNSQIAAYVSSTTVGTLTGNTDGGVATLTLTGGVTLAESNATLKDNLSLVVDDSGSAGDFVQIFTNGTHTMGGELVVKRGTLTLAGASTFKSVSGVKVEGGEMRFETEAATFGSESEVRNAEMNMIITGAGRVCIADGLTVNVNRLSVGGLFVENGDYTGVGGPANATVLPQLTGTGVLHVCRPGRKGSVLVFE